MKNKKSIYVFNIKDEIFLQQIQVLICSREDKNEFLIKKYDLDDSENELATGTTFKGVDNNNARIYILWIQTDKFKFDLYHIDTLLHEIVHIVEFILDEQGIEDRNSEVRAYYTSWLFRKISKKILKYII